MEAARRRNERYDSISHELSSCYSAIPVDDYWSLKVKVKVEEGVTSVRCGRWCCHSEEEDGYSPMPTVREHDRMARILLYSNCMAPMILQSVSDINPNVSKNRRAWRLAIVVAGPLELEACKVFLRGASYNLQSRDACVFVHCGHCYSRDMR